MPISPKIVSFASIAVGQLPAPILTRMVDKGLIEKATSYGPNQEPPKYATPLHYPLYMRTGVVAPIILGAAGIGLGFFGDKMGVRNPSTQQHALEFGASALTSGLVQMGMVMADRAEAKIPVMFPKSNGQQQVQMQQQQQVFPITGVPTNISTNGYARNGRLQVQ